MDKLNSTFKINPLYETDGYKISHKAMLVQVIKLMDYLYNNSNLKLKRKHDRYKQIKTRYK
jgi:hypothetical protein